MLRALTIVPLPVTVLILSMLSPTELSLFLGGLRLPPNRLALLVLVPIAVMRLISSRSVRMHTFDWLFLTFGAMTIAVYWGHSGHAGLVYGGSVALEAMGGYVIARAYIRTPEMLRQTMRVMLLAIMISATIALPEFLMGRNFTHDLLHQITGYYHPTAVQTRLGLTRAYGTFDHPIHYGTFCASMLALLWFCERGRGTRRKRAALVAGATLFSLSSAPLLSLGLQGFLFLWERTTRTLNGRLIITFAALTALYIAVDMISSRSPLAIIATRLTLDTWTGYYRLFIWEHGMNNVWAHPWTGLGLADWDRPWWMVADTIDAYWLVLTMRQGIPSFLVLVLAILLLIRTTSSKRHLIRDPAALEMMRGWMMSVVALCLIGATVHYWNVLQTYMFFLIGLGGVFADPVRRAVTRRSADRDPAGPVAPSGQRPRRRRAAPKGRSTRPQPVGAAAGHDHRNRPGPVRPRPPKPSRGPQRAPRQAAFNQPPACKRSVPAQSAPPSGVAHTRPKLPETVAAARRRSTPPPPPPPPSPERTPSPANAHERSRSTKPPPLPTQAQTGAAQAAPRQHAAQASHAGQRPPPLPSLRPPPLPKS